MTRTELRERRRIMAHRETTPIAILPTGRVLFEEDIPRMSLKRAIVELVSFGLIALALLYAILWIPVR